MGVQETVSGYQPICSDCGIALCWELSLEEYIRCQEFWDKWTCSECNPNYQGALARWLSNHKEI